MHTVPGQTAQTRAANQHNYTISSTTDNASLAPTYRELTAAFKLSQNIAWQRLIIETLWNTAFIFYIGTVWQLGYTLSVVTEYPHAIKAFTLNVCSLCSVFVSLADYISLLELELKIGWVACWLNSTFTVNNGLYLKTGLSISPLIITHYTQTNMKQNF